MKKQLALLLTAALALQLSQSVLAVGEPVPTVDGVTELLLQDKYSYPLPASSPWKFIPPDFEGRLSVSQDGRTATLFAPNLSVGGGWTDTNKHWDGNDKSLCWAATVSNMLDWYLDTAEQNGVDVGSCTRSHMDIFNRHFRGIWVYDEGYDLNNALSWYFSGYFTNSNEPDYNPTASDNPQKHLMLKRDPGGFLKHMPHVDGAFHQLFLGQGFDLPRYVGNIGEQYPFAEIADELFGDAGNLSTLQNFSDTLLRALQYGLVGLTVKTDNSLGGGHAVTLWGADFDPDTGIIKRLYITDSDDFVTQLRPVSIKARSPDRDGIYMTDYSMSNGTRWTRISDAQVLFANGAVRDKFYIPPAPDHCHTENIQLGDGTAITLCFNDSIPAWQITSIRSEVPADILVYAEYSPQGQMLHSEKAVPTGEGTWKFPQQKSAFSHDTLKKILFLDDTLAPVREAVHLKRSEQ